MRLDDWFLRPEERGNPATRLDSRHPDGAAWTTGNHVRALPHGAAYFADLLVAIGRMRAGDLLLFTDWRGDPDERLDGPGTEVARVLSEAAGRGVDVRIMVPGENNDQPLTKSAGRGAYGKLLEGGVRIFEYEPTMIHIKSIVTDTLFSMIGSSNLDPRSAEINEELDVVVYDRDFGRQMEETFTQDLRQSREYTLEQFRRRSLWERTVEWLAYPFRSQL